MKNKAQIGIIMGSDSDLGVMKEAAMILEEFGVNYEISVISAHRTADKLYEYASHAKDKGIKVIIAGAGGAAHLPGMTASMTTLPIIGVPITTKSMGGLDSLLSIAQMPGGVPVATVAIDGAKNAGLLAIQILSLEDKNLDKKFSAYKNKMNKTIKMKGAKLLKIGFKKYLG